MCLESPFLTSRRQKEKKLSAGRPTGLTGFSFGLAGFPMRITGIQPVLQLGQTVVQFS